MNDNEFYERCAQLLNVQHEGNTFPYYRRTRWNNRAAGRGRFPGRGIIRCFGSKVHIALTAPITISKICESKQDAIRFLEQHNG